MVDRLPLHLHKERRQRDGQVCQHEQGEGEGIDQLLRGGGVDAVPLGDGGDAAQHQQRGQNAAHTLQQGAEGEPHACALHQSQYRQRDVGQQAQGREDKGRQDGHGHIKAAPAAPGRAPEELAAVAQEHLHVALGPAQALAAGLAEIGGLFVIEHGAFADGDLLAPENVVHRELNVLGEQVEAPAVALVQNALGEQEARSAYCGAAAQAGARPVEIAALPQKPQGVSGADPVAAEVLAVAVAGDDLVAVGEHLVHPLYVVRGEDVVGIEYKVAVKARRVVRADVLEQEVQGVALAYVQLVEALVYHRAVGAGDGGGAVGAVVRRHEHRDQGHIVGLRPQTVQQAGDNILLVPGGDEHRVAVGLGRRGQRLRLFGQHQGDVEELVGVADEKQRRDNGVDGAQRGLHRGTSFRFFLPLW